MSTKVVVGRGGSGGWSGTIQVVAAADGVATVDVFEAGGRLVREWRDVRVDAGRADVMWDGDDSKGQRCAQGVYFVRVAIPGVGHSRAKFVRIVP